MKLRLFVIVLVLANVLFGVWSLGWLDEIFGVTARTDREPERVLQQVNPQSMTIVAPSADAGAPGRPSGARVTAAPPATSTRSPASVTVAPPRVGVDGDAPTSAETSVRPGAASAPSVMLALGAPSTSSPGASGAVSMCVEVAGLTTAQVSVAERSLASLPPSAWRRVTVERPASFAAVMGPFATREALRSKVAELERLKIKFERLPQPNADGSTPVSAPTLLVLARAATREAAAATVSGYAQRGVRTARVVSLSPADTVHRLIVEGATEAQMQAIKASGTGVDGKTFDACAA